MYIERVIHKDKMAPKTNSLAVIFTDWVIISLRSMQQKSPGSSLTRSGHSLTSSVGEFTRQASTAAGKDDESEHDGYCSDTTSSNPSPTCTQCFVNHHLQDIDSTRPVNSNTRIAAQGLFGRGLSESSVHPNDPAVFNRMQSLERSSVTNNYSQLYSIDKQHRGSSGSVDEDKRESPYHFGAVGFENFPPHVTPQRSSSNSITDTDPLHLQRSPSCSSRERHGLCTQQKQRENDSAFGSTSETDDVSSVESEECTSECTPVATMESASTPTTIHGDSSGLSVQTATSLLDPNETAMDTPCNLEVCMHVHVHVHDACIGYAYRSTRVNKHVHVDVHVHVASTFIICIFTPMYIHVHVHVLCIIVHTGSAQYKYIHDSLL